MIIWTPQGRDTAADRLFGGGGADTLAGDNGDTITGGLGLDSLIVEVDSAVGSATSDATVISPVVIRDFAYDSDAALTETLLLRDETGAAYSAADIDANLVILSTPSADNDTVLTYNGEVIAILEGNDADVLDADRSWLANVPQTGGPGPVPAG